MKSVVACFENKNIMAQFDNTKTLIIEFKGSDINRLTRKSGILTGIHRAIQTKFIFRIENTNINSLLIKEPDLTAIACNLDWIMDFGVLPQSEIRRYLIRFVNKKADVPLVKRLISKLKSKSKRQHRKTRLSNTIKHVEGFDAENLFKKEIIVGTKKIFVYYSEEIVNFIKKEYFDLLFIDGTHLKTMVKNQVIMVRLYSSKLYKIITLAYAIAGSKKTEIYQELFGYLGTLGVLNNCKIVTSDFEIAIRKGFEQAILKPVKFRFCFFHLIAATRKYSSSINKTMIIQNLHLNKSHMPTTPHIFRYFSFLIFVKKPLQHFLFQALKFLYRKISKNLANEIFIAYFEKTYITGSLSKNFVLDFEDSNIITNNFIEGLNSSLKRHNRGQANINSFLDWMKIDAKQSVMELNENKIKIPNSNPKFREFYDSCNSNGTFFRVIVDYVHELSHKSDSVKKQRFVKERTLDYLNFTTFLQHVTVSWDATYLTVFENNQVLRRFSSADTQEKNDFTYLSKLEPNYESYFARLKYK